MSQDHTLRKTQVLLQHYHSTFRKLSIISRSHQPTQMSSSRLLHRRSHCEDRRRPANRCRLRHRAAACRRTRSTQSARICRRLANQPPQPQLQEVNRSLRHSSASADSTQRNIMNRLTKQAWDGAGRSVLILIQEKVDV